MSWIRVSAVVLIIALVFPPLLGGTSLADDKEDNTDSSDEVIFVPPEIGAPKDRMGAGTRGASSDHDIGVLLLLAPEEGGLTTLSSPSLIWRLHHGHRGDLVVGLNSFGAPGTELRIKGPFAPGDYGLDLGRSNLQLETDRIYEWQVTLLDQHTGAVVGRSAGLIQRVPDQMKAANPAAAGLWFDALSQVMDISPSGRARASNLAQLDQLLKSAGIGP